VFYVVMRRKITKALASPIAQDLALSVRIRLAYEDRVASLRKRFRRDILHACCSCKDKCAHSTFLYA